MKTGFYKSKKRDTIYYIYKNHEEDCKEYPWLVSTFEYESTIDGLKRYEDETGNDIALQYLEDKFEETPLKFKFTTIANENDAIIEKKLPNSKKIKQLKQILKDEINSNNVFYNNATDDYHSGYFVGMKDLAEQLLDFIENK